jgi:hypothetical protein
MVKVGKAKFGVRNQQIKIQGQPQFHKATPLGRSGDLSKIEENFKSKQGWNQKRLKTTKTLQTNHQWFDGFCA